MSAFIMTDTVFAAAQSALSKKHATLEKYADVAAPFLGCDPSVFVTAYTERCNATKRATMLADVSKAVESYKVPRGIVSLLSRLNGLSTELGKPYTLGFSLHENGAAYAKVVEGRAPRKSKGGNGTVGAKSRISALVACERGIKAGDSFKVEKRETGYMVDGVEVKRGTLAQFIMDQYANNKGGERFTNTNAVLVKYGYKLKGGV